MWPVEVGRKFVVQQNNLAEDNKMRFSDEKLAQFHGEFKDHIAEYKERQKSQDECIQKLIEAQQKNTDAISTIIEDTREVLQLHRDLQAATRVGISAQKFAIWLTKWGAIGAGLAVAFNWGMQHVQEFFK